MGAAYRPRTIRFFVVVVVIVFVIGVVVVVIVVITVVVIVVNVVAVVASVRFPSSVFISDRDGHFCDILSKIKRNDDDEDV